MTLPGHSERITSPAERRNAVMSGSSLDPVGTAHRVMDLGFEVERLREALLAVVRAAPYDSKVQHIAAEALRDAR